MYTFGLKTVSLLDLVFLPFPFVGHHRSRLARNLLTYTTLTFASLSRHARFGTCWTHGVAAVLFVVCESRQSGMRGRWSTHQLQHWASNHTRWERWTLRSIWSAQGILHRWLADKARGQRKCQGHLPCVTRQRHTKDMATDGDDFISVISLFSTSASTHFMGRFEGVMCVIECNWVPMVFGEWL